MFVLAHVSSRNTSVRGSSVACPAFHSSRWAFTSGRSCSLARSDFFFESDPTRATLALGSLGAAANQSAREVLPRSHRELDEPLHESCRRTLSTPAQVHVVAVSVRSPRSRDDVA